jgi:hypothetical protein
MEEEATQHISGHKKNIKNDIAAILFSKIRNKNIGAQKFVITKIVIK